MRYAIIDFLDLVNFESDDLREALNVYETLGAEKSFRGIFDYETSYYLDNVDIIDRLGVGICSLD